MSLWKDDHSSGGKYLALPQRKMGPKSKKQDSAAAAAGLIPNEVIIHSRHNHYCVAAFLRKHRQFKAATTTIQPTDDRPLCALYPFTSGELSYQRGQNISTQRRPLPAKKMSSIAAWPSLDTLCEHSRFDATTCTESCD